MTACLPSNIEIQTSHEIHTHTHTHRIRHYTMAVWKILSIENLYNFSIQTTNSWVIHCISYQFEITLKIHHVQELLVWCVSTIFNAFYTVSHCISSLESWRCPRRMSFVVGIIHCIWNSIERDWACEMAACYPWYDFEKHRRLEYIIYREQKTIWNLNNLNFVQPFADQRHCTRIPYISSLSSLSPLGNDRKRKKNRI